MMDNEQVSAPALVSSSGTAGTSTASSTSVTSASHLRPSVPQLSVYSGISDRQTVQVIQQALHRQPNTAAQYLQQMYAAQQQHLMLHTAALQQQQQHLSSAQLQSLAAVQQASIVAGRQNSNQNGNSNQQTGSQQATINLTAAPAASQLMSRAQGVSPAPSTISQQAVLLGNTTSPTLTASQAQMYLRAQMLIFTPTATIAAVHPEPSSMPAGQQSSSAQVQNLAIRSQQGAASASPSQAQLQALGLRQAPAVSQSSLSGQLSPQPKSTTLGVHGSVGKAGGQEACTEGDKKSEGGADTAPRGGAMSRSVTTVSRSATTVSSQTLLAPAFAQLHQQPHHLLQPHKATQLVIQPQTQPRGQAPPALHGPAQAVHTLTLQPAPVVSAQGQLRPVSVLPKLPTHAAQTAVLHAAVGSQPSAVNPAIQTMVQPLQLSPVNLQIQSAPAPAAVPNQDGNSNESLTVPVVRELDPGPCIQQLGTPGPNLARAAESDRSAAETGGVGATDRVNVRPALGSPAAMTSGNGSSAPSVTGSAPQNAENKPPQAIVKPQILTHVIEGFVIQEGAEPFPVERPSLLIEKLKQQKLQPDSEKPPTQDKSAGAQDCDMEDVSQQELKEQKDEPTLKCELCGLVDFAYKFKRSKRFCSTLCAKRYNVGCTKRMGLFHPDKRKMEKHKKRRSRSNNSPSLSGDIKKQTPAPAPPTLAGSMSSPLPSQPSHDGSSPCSDMSSYDEPPSPLSAASSGAPRPPGERGQDGGPGRERELPLLMQHFLPSDPTRWNVEDVFSFIQSLPGCQDIAEEFRSQEIDGQALLLLKEDHLMSTMNIKLGPALKIYARISMLKDC